MKKSNKPSYCNFRSITFHKGVLESEAFDLLTLSDSKIFIYIWSCLQWTKTKVNNKKIWVVSNNGQIEIDSAKMKKQLGICKATCTNGIHKLIKIGFITLTRVGGNRVCHMYKILYQVVPEREERWRKFPEKNWEGECPKAPDNLVGRDTRFKTHPNKSD